MHSPTRRRAAFSIIELLAVLVVMGVLVGLAMPRFHRYKQKAHLASMVSDLRNLAAAQEEYWNATKRYSADTSAIDLTLSPGVSITLESADSTGWSARATHSAGPTICAIFYGTAPVLPPAEKANVIGCGG
jgi:prepilin-type N-terminal cleavage/methylation domain-containing protein